MCINITEKIRKSNIRNVDDCCAKLNEDLDRIHHWASSNGLYRNPTKSKGLNITQRNQNIVVGIPITLGNPNTQ